MPATLTSVSTFQLDTLEKEMIAARYRRSNLIYTHLKEMTGWIISLWVLISNGDDWKQRPPDKEAVLLGKTGNGKSTTGNNIFYKEDFNSECSLDGVTTKCELQSTTSPDGHVLNVIDTPGLFGFSPGPTETIEEISRCINFAKNGIHAILFVLSIKNRFSKEEEEAVRNLQTHFGEKQFFIS
ncbi:hypothetical protein C5167_044383 [Papaver somniferum]|uniref:AIG1-type G domain-containing protein n=1 Tax=Papaver somniferum TaxID=3469 RepID=A0A4Y7L8C9_PAPSO|nr:hypothetical protein C5167_044383 [Papaver somniferum]